MTRSEMMSGIRSWDTKPELYLRRGLHALGFRYRLHDGTLPGRPDMVFRRFGAVIFVHGCFWHGHPGCGNATIPKTNTDFWTDKIVANRARDARAATRLEEAGWRVLTVWECAIRTDRKRAASVLLPRVAHWLTGFGATTEIGADG